MASKTGTKITVYRGWVDPGHYVWSPFVTKLECRLRLSNLSYTSDGGSMSSSPTGKIPYIDLSYPNQQTECLSDSSLIINHLMEVGLIEEFNSKLSNKDKGSDLAIRALLEDKIYFYHTYERWMKNYYVMRDQVMKSIPYPLRIVIGLLAYRANAQKLYDQGVARYSDEERLNIKREIWQGIAGFLEESKKKKKGIKAGDEECFWLLGGNMPTEADATLFGFVASTLVCTAAPESSELVKDEFSIVVDYAERIHHKYFPDYQIW